MSKELFSHPRWKEMPVPKVVGEVPKPSKEERIATKKLFLEHLKKIGVLTEEEYVEKLEEYTKSVYESDEW